MKCECGVDHWLHLAQGLYGIVGMMAVLQAREVRASDSALRVMEERMQKLREHIATERNKSQHRPSAD